MKTNWWIIVLVFSGVFFVQCTSEDTTTEEEVVQESPEEIEKQLEYIKLLNQELTGGKPQNEIVSATALFNASSKFVNAHPNHEKTPAVMELAAKASEIMGKPQQAINIMQKLVDEFPVTDETPKYMANIARLHESKGDIEKAKEMYDQLLEQFPEDPMAIEAKNYIQNFMGKSEAEILMFLDSVNAVQ